MTVSEKRIDLWIKQWEGASKAELKNRLKSLEKKNKTADVVAEIKAITALLS